MHKSRYENTKEENTEKKKNRGQTLTRCRTGTSNKKKAKALWIGSAKGNKTKPLGFHFSQDPTKTLSTNLSYNHDKNNIFFCQNLQNGR